MPRLAMFAPAPVIEAGDVLRLDAKFVEGMLLHAAQWPGPLRCYLWRGSTEIPFGTEMRADDLGFELVLLNPGEMPAAQHLDGVDMILASADDTRTLSLVPAARSAGARIVYSIEYTLGTRLAIQRIEGRSPLRQLRGTVWHLQHEARRRRAFRQADGLQINGYPAEDAYAAMNPASLVYLDGRMTADMMASPENMEARLAHLRSGAPLRLIHSGRLEAMKGAGDLLPVMQALHKAGIEATLDIYGTGSMRQLIADGLGAFGGVVRLHDPVSFRDVLVQVNRTQADIFLSCHPQSDPSCSYIEAMGGGLCVAGYGNQMWRRMAAASGGGVVAALGDPAALAGQIAHLHRDRGALILHAERGLAFARQHDFATEFARRMAHLRDLAGLNACQATAGST